MYTGYKRCIICTLYRDLNFTVQFSFIIDTSENY